MAHLKLSNDIYVDAVGVAKDSTGTQTLQAWIDNVYSNNSNKIVDCGTTEKKSVATTNKWAEVDGAWTKFEIPFHKTFKSTPVVVGVMTFSGVPVGGMGRMVLVLESTTKTGCVFKVANKSGATRSVGISWIAVQD